MVRASQAIRMGLRAAWRNPELSFVKALLDLMSTVLGSLPLLFAGWILWRTFSGLPILSAVMHVAHALPKMGWPIAAALFIGGVISWALAAGFWAGALPLVAIDIEMNARPAKGLFFRLAQNGFARVAGSSLVSIGISTLVALCLLEALLIGVPLFALDPSPQLALGMAAILTCAFGTGFFVDFLGKLALVRAAVLGDGPATSFLGAAKLLGERTFVALGIGVVFVLLELVAATALGGLLGPMVAEDWSLDTQLFAFGPRIALTIATTTVLAFLELARQGALAALATDAEGLLTLPPEPVIVQSRQYSQQRRAVQAWELRPPAIAVQPLTPEAPEPVIEALPVPEAVDDKKEPQS